MIPMKTLTINGKTYCLEDADSVSFDTSQTLSAEQQAQARKNIGAAEDALCSIVCTASGKNITLNDASDTPLRGLKLYGKTAQNGTPAADSPVALESVGAAGAVNVMMAGKNLIPTPASQTYNGVTATAEDGAVTFAGVTTAGYNYYVFDSRLPAGEYCVCWNRVRVENLTLYTRNVDAGTILLRGDGTFELDTPARITLYCNWSAAGAAVGGTIRPILCVGSATTAWEHYKEPQIFTALTPDGLAGVPVKTGGNYTDENGQQWICDEIDLARGVYVHRIGVVESYTDEEIAEPFLSTTGELTAGATVLYVFSDAVETPLDEDVIAAYASLYLNKPNTTIINDAEAYMELKYVADTKSYIDNKFTELHNAILASGANV